MEETAPQSSSNEGKKNSNSRLDGGWGWVVCFGAFMVHILTVGQQNIAGVIYSIMVDEFHTKRAETAWVTGLSSSVMYLVAPISTYLAERYGCRVVVITGGIISAISMGSSSFAKTIGPLYFTYGVLWGIGTSFGLFPSLVMLTKYFRKKLALVNGIALTGAAVGGLALGPLMQYFATNFGTPNMFRFLGALNVLVIFSGLLYRPLHEERHDSKASKEPLKHKIRCLFRHKAYVVWLIGLCTLMIVFLVPFVHLVRLAEDKNVSKDKSSFLASFMAGGGFIGSLLFGHLSDHPRCNRLYACQFAILSMGVACTLLTMAAKFEWFVVLSAVFGVFDGCYEMLVPVITSDLVGINLTPTAVGSLYCLLAIPKTIGPPVAGWIFDVSQSYNTAFYVTGGLMTLSSIIMFLIPRKTATANAILVGRSDPEADTTEETTSLTENNTNTSLLDNQNHNDVQLLNDTNTKKSTLVENSSDSEKRKSTLICYSLAFKSKATPDDYYDINREEGLVVADKVTTV